MAYNQYQGYSGNPYGGDDPTGTDKPSINPYSANNNAQYRSDAATGHQLSTQPVGSPQYNQAPSPKPQQNGYVSTLLSNDAFLQRVDQVRSDIRTLTSQIQSIATTHQRILTSSDTTNSTALDSLVTQTQVLNTQITFQIKFLETDAKKSRDNTIKNSQVAQLKTTFKKELESYRREEADYERRYREQIARQYRIVNPNASEDEVREAQDADWGNEGVFQTALRTNRSATANTVLGAVRARHAVIQRIEKTLGELNQLFVALAQEVEVQDEPVRRVDEFTQGVVGDVENANEQLTRANESAARARRLKWYAFWGVLVLVIILAVVLGVVFGVVKKGSGIAT